jgi:hypothetical protein
MLTLADGTFFPLGCCAIPWGRASGPVGLAPEALEECVYSSKVFSAASSLCEVFISAGLGGVSAGLGGTIRMCRHSLAFSANPGGVAVRRAPSLGPFEAIGAGSPTCLYAPSPSLRGTEGEVSTTPIGRVANCGFLFELLPGYSSGRPCSVR